MKGFITAPLAKAKGGAIYNLSLLINNRPLERGGGS